MKKIFLLLILLSSFIFADIDERKVDVYFANGIKTKDKDAEKNAKLLDTAIESKLGTTKYKQQIGKVTYAYNDTFLVPYLPIWNAYQTRVNKQAKNRYNNRWEEADIKYMNQHILTL